jgi:hypothetical protein
MTRFAANVGLDVKHFAFREQAQKFAFCAVTVKQCQTADYSGIRRIISVCNVCCPDVLNILVVVLYERKVKEFDRSSPA